MRWFKRGLIVAVTALLLFPIYWMIVGSLLGAGSVLATPPKLLPIPPDWRIYLWFLGTPQDGTQSGSFPGLFFKWLTNTAWVTATGAVGAVLVTMAGAYALVFLRWPGKRVAIGILVASLTIPGSLIFVGRFALFYRLGIMHVPVGLVVVYLWQPSYMLLCRGALGSIPGCLRDMALLDGCGEWRALLYVILPLAVPLVGVVALFTSVGILGDYLWQMIFTEGGPLETLLVGIMRMVKYYNHAQGYRDFGISLALAGGVILMMPTLVTFFVAQRCFREGGLSGALKE